MRILNEGIASKLILKITAQDVSGKADLNHKHYLMNQQAACMAYVDLNPIRANIAPTPEESNYTSIQQRISYAKTGEQPKQLQPFVGNPRLDMPKGLPFELLDYLALVDITGRCIR
ncbi:MAG: hypothetical protein ACI971_002098 [Colwellia sp.]|jgi:hypothetical protein